MMASDKERSQTSSDGCCMDQSQIPESKSNTGQNITSKDNGFLSSLGIRDKIAGSSLLGKKFGDTSRLALSSKMWLHTIPTRDCDILMTFPSKTEDHVLMWLLSRLKSRTPELTVHVRHHSNTGVYGFYFTAAYNSLLKVAEELSMKKQMKAEYGGGMKEFVYEDRDYFEGVDDSPAFFTSQERQNIVRHMLFNLRAVNGDVLDKVKFLEGQAIVPYLISKQVIQQVLPLHNNEDIVFLRQHWVQAFTRSQPLDKICEYFGVKIAMYFAYLGHYTRALMLPAFLGIILWFSDGRNQYVDDLSFTGFAFFNVLWASLYLENWKRTSSERAYQWGTLDKEDELLVEPRPLFYGYTVKSPVTGRHEPYYPAWKRAFFRYFISLPIVTFCLGVVFVTMWGIFELQDWVNAKIKLEELPFFTKFLPKILLAISIGVFDDIYKKIAYWLNDKENYRLQETYETNLIIKLILFQFVNSFLSLFYIAFYLQDMDRLKDQLATLLITRQVIGNIKESLVPYIVGKAKLVKLGYDMTEGLSAESIDQQNKELDEAIHSQGEAQAATEKMEQDMCHDQETDRLINKNPDLSPATELINLDNCEVPESVNNIPEQPTSLQSSCDLETPGAATEDNIIQNDSPDGTTEKKETNSLIDLTKQTTPPDGSTEEEEINSLDDPTKQTTPPDGSSEPGKPTDVTSSDILHTADDITQSSGLRYRGVRTEKKRTSEGELEVTHSGSTLTQAEVEATQAAYEDTIEDYLEMLIQFGYVTLFSSAFPLAALCALLNNIIEIRSDAFKLCLTLQRPFGQRVESIGIWQSALEVMSVLAVMVNCALIGFSGLADRLFPDLNTIERIIFIVILEHVVLVFKLLLAQAIPDVPTWVAEEKARLEFLRRVALKRLESQGGSAHTPVTPSGNPWQHTPTETGRRRVSPPDMLPAERDNPRGIPGETPSVGNSMLDNISVSTQRPLTSQGQGFIQELGHVTSSVKIQLQSSGQSNPENTRTIRQKSVSSYDTSD